MRQPIKVNEIEVGDVFSESSHYLVQELTPTTVKFKHLESNQVVELTHDYVSGLLDCAEQFHEEIKVGKTDKYWTAKQVTEALAKDPKLTAREGDVKVPGIRTIFDTIMSTDVFTVCFVKQDKSLSKKAYDAKVQEAVDKVVSTVEAAKTSRKSMVEAAKAVVEDLIKNPVLDYEPGEERVLRGYKQQFRSNSGFYDVLDMDLNETRQANINTIKWLIYKQVKYIVE